MKIKLLILFFALAISVFSAEKGGTYTEFRKESILTRKYAS